MIEEGTRVPRPERVHRNVVSEKFTYALQRFEERGWITRGSEFVLVRSKRSLLDWATSAEPPEEIAFQVSVAIELVESDLSALSAAAVEQRRRELLALKRLMEEGFADSNWSLRGRVRFVPKSNSL